MDSLFSDKSIDVDWTLGPDLWRAAGVRYGTYFPELEIVSP